MSKYSVKKIFRKNKKVYKSWKQILKASKEGTLFHNPDFLAYHKDKFNEHHLGVFKGQTLVGVLPMALFETDGKKIAKSPYGGSFGGFIFDRVLRYKGSKKIVTAFLEYIKNLNVQRVEIIPPPIYLSNLHDDTFIFALLEQGFKMVNSDISSVTYLNKEDIKMDLFSSRRRNKIRKAQKNDIYCKFNSDKLDDFWHLMEFTFKKHGTTATHTKEEWRWLSKNLPDKVWYDIAYKGKKPVAGIGHFKIREDIDSAFYLCTDSDFLHLQGLSYLISEVLVKDKAQGIRCFDFGTSSVNMKARQNIFRFKEGFGAQGVFRHTYRWDNNKND